MTHSVYYHIIWIPCTDMTYSVIAVLLPAAGIEPTSVPKNLLTTEALYHSATEVLIEFDKYFGSRVV